MATRNAGNYAPVIQINDTAVIAYLSISQEQVCKIRTPLLVNLICCKILLELIFKHFMGFSAPVTWFLWADYGMQPQEYIKYRMGRPWSFTPAATRPALIHYFDLQGKVLDVPAEAQVRRAETSLAGWECHIRAGQELPPVSDGRSLMGRGYFILEGRETELRDKARRVKAMFRLA